MNPQNIVYISLILVGLGVTICAIDPLKPVQLEYVWAEVEIPKGSNYYVDVQRTMEINDDIVTDFKFEDGKWKFKIDLTDIEQSVETELKVSMIKESQSFSGVSKNG